MTLTGKQIAILIEEGFENSEVFEPMRAMKDFGSRVTLIGSGSSDTYKGKRGNESLTIDTTADKVKASDFSAFIVPGGHAPDRMRLYQAMIDLIRNAFMANIIVAAICHGPQLLISAEIVKGRRMTSWPSIAIDLKNAGARWVDEPVVIDGNLITSRAPADIPRFNKAIINALIT